MPNYNRITLIGHLTRDPECRYLSSGTAICDCGIATTKKWKNKDTGQTNEKTCFVDLVIWGASGERFAEWFAKGQAVFIEGELELDQWDDKDTGQKRSKHKVNVTGFQNCAGKSTSGSRSQSAPQTQPENASAVNSDEEVPF